MFNLPNILALFRVLLAPLMFFILINYSNGGYFSGLDISWINYFCGLIFTVASITDFFDGYIARTWDQKTKLGGIIDPLADKMLVLAAFLGLMMISRANPWAIYIILIREFFITGLRIAMVSENIDVAASMAGKVKTVLQMFAIGFLTMQWPLANFLLWLAVIFTLYSGFEYLLAYAKHYRKEVV